MSTEVAAITSEAVTRTDTTKHTRNAQVIECHQSEARESGLVLLPPQDSVTVFELLRSAVEKGREFVLHSNSVAQGHEAAEMSEDVALVITVAVAILVPDSKYMMPECQKHTVLTWLGGERLRPSCTSSGPA